MERQDRAAFRTMQPDTVHSNGLAFAREVLDVRFRLRDWYIRVGRSPDRTIPLRLATMHTSNAQSEPPAPIPILFSRLYKPPVSPVSLDFSASERSFALEGHQGLEWNTIRQELETSQSVPPDHQT